VGFLQGGQSRDFLVTTTDTPPFTIAISDHTGVVIASKEVLPFSSSGGGSNAAAAFTRARTDVVVSLRQALAIAEGGAVEEAKQMVDALQDRLKEYQSCDGRITHLLTDLHHPDTHKGQIGKGFGSQNAFERWGRHYIPGVVCGHANQWAINFKDEGSKLYGGNTTKDLVLHGDDIFNSLPPPTPSCAYYSSYSSSSSSYASAPISMAAVNSAAGPCFLGSSRVLMAGGVNKNCRDVRPGDVDVKGNRSVRRRGWLP